MSDTTDHRCVGLYFCADHLKPIVHKSRVTDAWVVVHPRNEGMSFAPTYEKAQEVAHGIAEVQVRGGH